jgi:putative oxidoreductase
MKIAKQIPAFLLGALFIFGGASHLFKFGPPPPPMTGDPETFMKLFMSTGYMDVIKICELLFGILVFIPKTRALGLILLAPIVVNILIFELHIAKAPGIGVALVVVNALAIYLNKEKYSSILA